MPRRKQITPKRFTYALDGCGTNEDEITTILKEKLVEENDTDGYKSRIKIKRSSPCKILDNSAVNVVCQMPQVENHVDVLLRTSDTDEPWDLSTASTKPLNLSFKGRNEQEHCSINSSHTQLPFLLPESENPLDQQSSLSTLQRRFGDNSLHFQDSSRDIPISSLITNSARSCPIFTSGLAKTSTSCYSSDMDRNQTTISVDAIESCSSNIVSSSVEQSDKCIKYTNFACSCSKEFSCLYKLTLHMKQTGHTCLLNEPVEMLDFPKLVRGQDMWLHQGSEQTRQILCCMHCKQSFHSLPELTVHMIETKHYAKIVGSEMKRMHKCAIYCDNCSSNKKTVENGQHFVNEIERGEQLLQKKTETKEQKPCVWSLNSSCASQDETAVSSSDSVQCENCHKKVNTSKFVDHMHHCSKQAYATQSRDDYSNEPSSSALEEMENFIERSFFKRKDLSTTEMKKNKYNSMDIGHVHACQHFPSDHSDNSHGTKDKIMCKKARKSHYNSPLSNDKYLHENYINDCRLSTSALESLQGLVYGKSLKSEHPLDSLEKLIHGDGIADSFNGQHSKLTSTMGGTVILVNPIVTIMPHSSGMSTMQIGIPSSSLSGLSADVKDETEETTDNDLKCNPCKKTFATKGSYRYHRSRCPLSKFTEQFKGSWTDPAMDHSTKFSKYYQLASELAKNTKE